MTIVASQNNFREVIKFFFKTFLKFISPRGWPHLAAMHEGKEEQKNFNFTCK